MKTWPIFLLACAAAVPPGRTAPVSLRLPKNQDAFFVENDFVYRRLLRLGRDGFYRQINRERNTAAEVDRGTWTQDPDGTVLLHDTHGGLRFRALFGGRLSLDLADPARFGGLPTAADAIRRFLAGTNDVVFAADALAESPLNTVGITLEPAVESFGRDDLESIARQIDDFAWCEQRQTFRLTLSKPAGSPTLLIQRNAVFQAADLPRVQRDYHVGRGESPPFYFVQTDARTFAREAGTWQTLP